MDTLDIKKSWKDQGRIFTSLSRVIRPVVAENGSLAWHAMLNQEQGWLLERQQTQALGNKCRENERRTENPEEKKQCLNSPNSVSRMIVSVIGSRKGRRALNGGEP